MTAQTMSHRSVSHDRLARTFGLVSATCLVLLSVTRVASGHDAPAPLNCTGGSTSLTPCGLARDTVSPSRAGQTTLTVRNAGASDIRYASSCAYSPPVSKCWLQDTPVVAPANGTTTVTVYYKVAGDTGEGLVTLAIDGGGTNKAGTTITVDASP